MIFHSKIIMIEFLLIFTYHCFQGLADELMFRKMLKGQNAKPDEVSGKQSKVQRGKLDHQEMQNIITVKGKKSKQSRGQNKFSNKELQLKSQNDIARTNEVGVAKKATVRRAKVIQHIVPQQQFNVSQGNTSVSDDNVTNLMGGLLKIDTNSTNDIMNTIQTTGGVVGKGLSALVRQWDKTLIFAAMMGLCVVIGYYSGLIAMNFVRVRKPKLVFETSRIFILEAIRQPIVSVTKAVEIFHKSSDLLCGVVLAPALENRLRAIASNTKSTCQNKGFYSNLLFLGPDGTGKTTVSKNLAKYCGMDFALVLGSAVACSDTDAVDDINELLDWANLHIKGVVLFISRADVFLQKITSDKVSNDLKAAIDVFLYRTSAQSKKVMLVLASNAPQNIDQAVYDRLNQILNFDLPGEKERRRIIYDYFDNFVLKPNRKLWKKRRLVLDQFDYGALCSKLAARTAGMSGRALSKLGVAWQAAAYASDDGRLTEQMCIEICDDVVREHQQMVK